MMFPVSGKAFQTLKDSITSEKTMAYFDPGRPIIVRIYIGRML